LGIYSGHHLLIFYHSLTHWVVFLDL
jgi:hypothetical protein